MHPLPSWPLASPNVGLKGSPRLWRDNAADTYWALAFYSFTISPPAFFLYRALYYIKTSRHTGSKFGFRACIQGVAFVPPHKAKKGETPTHLPLLLPLSLSLSVSLPLFLPHSPPFFFSSCWVIYPKPSDILAPVFLTKPLIYHWIIN